MMASGARAADINSIVRDRLEKLIGELEEELDADVTTVFGPILYGSDNHLRAALETITPSNRRKIAIILDTPGGIVEVVERMVEIIRHHYKEVTFIVPDRAMSAGTVFVMSGDEIMMDYFSRLGPIDPQVVKDNRLVPALSYLVQFKRLVRKSQKGELSTAEFALLTKFDLAEIHQYEQARTLTVSLLEKWLVAYKFKNWITTESTKTPVTEGLRQKRAREIAKTLSSNLKWRSHGRGISMETLRGDEIKLLIDDFSKRSKLSRLIRDYFELLQDFTRTRGVAQFINTREFF